MQVQGEEEEGSVGEVSVLPILGAVGSESPATGQPSALSMQLRAFTELHRVSPLRAALAAMLAVLQRLNGISQGCAPLLPWKHDSAEPSQPMQLLPQLPGSCSKGDRSGASPPATPSSSGSSLADSPSSSGSDASRLGAKSQAFSDFATHNGGGSNRRKSRVSILGPCE